MSDESTNERIEEEVEKIPRFNKKKSGAWRTEEERIKHLTAQLRNKNLTPEDKRMLEEALIRRKIYHYWDLGQARGKMGLGLVAFIAKYMKCNNKIVSEYLSLYGLTSKSSPNKSMLLQKVWEDKGTFIQEICSLSLNIIRDRLLAMNANEKEKKTLNISDMKSLTTMITDLNGMLRLDSGLPTLAVSVKHTHEKTIEVIEELKKVDPILQYDKEGAEEAVERYQEVKQIDYSKVIPKETDERSNTE